MAMEEKLTYIGYRDGINPRILTLGSLVSDFANPKTQDPYVPEQLIAEDRDLWAFEDPVENCWASFSRGKRCSVGGDIVNLAELNVSRTNDTYNIVVAKYGSKVELLKPAKFFENITLKSDKARFWLESRLTVSRKSRYYYGLTLQDPKIWLLTGLYLMKDATCLSIAGKSSGLGGSVTVPLPDRSGIAAALQMNPNPKRDTKDGITVAGGATFPGERVWVAQYHGVKAKYFHFRDGTELSLKRLKLLNVFDMRASRGEASAAEVGIEEIAVDSGEEETSEESYGSKYWSKFAEELKDVEEELK